MGPDRLDARAIIEQLKDDPRFKRFERAQAGQQQVLNEDVLAHVAQSPQGG